MKLASENLQDFSREMCLIQKAKAINGFPEILHCGIFIHEGEMLIPSLGK